MGSSVVVAISETHLAPRTVDQCASDVMGAVLHRLEPAPPDRPDVTALRPQPEQRAGGHVDDQAVAEDSEVEASPMRAEEGVTHGLRRRTVRVGSTWDK